MISLEKPEGFKDSQDVVGCFIEFENKILMLRRNPEKPEGGTWCSPGGKVEFKDGGDRWRAIAREVEEETGIGKDKDSFKLVAPFYVTYPNGKNFLYHKYILKLDAFPKIHLQKEEHSEFAWLSPKDALLLDLILHEDDTIKHAYGI